jgi:predicted transglutaminase-like cysteine proteinase
MQNRHHSILALLTLLCVFSVAAAAQTSSAAPPTAAPQSQAAPQGQSGAPAGTTQGRQTTIDDELQLTPDQKQKIAAVIDDENKQMGTIRDDASLKPEQKQAKAIQVRQDGATKIRAVLNPDQLQKLAALQERARQQQQQQSATPNAPH